MTDLPAVLERVARSLFEYDKTHGLEHDGWTWPEHEGDDGYRGNGAYLTIIPRDIAERYRDRAKVVNYAMQSNTKDAVISFDMGAPEGDTSFLMIGLKRPDGSFEVLHGVYGAEAEALYRALNMVPALKAALQPSAQPEKVDLSAIRSMLKDIRLTPSRPFPDRGAHGETSFGDAVFRAWSRTQQLAQGALDTLDKMESAVKPTDKEEK